VILVNEGSPDRCGDIIREYEAKCRSSVDLAGKRGVSAARNVGKLPVATGKYLALIDSDDYWKPISHRPCLHRGKEKRGGRGMQLLHRFSKRLKIHSP
jgi:glycosyltransferase involved in cell wall biosynthesis